MSVADDLELQAFVQMASNPLAAYELYQQAYQEWKALPHEPGPATTYEGVRRLLQVARAASQCGKTAEALRALEQAEAQLAGNTTPLSYAILSLRGDIAYQQRSFGAASKYYDSASTTAASFGYWAEASNAKGLEAACAKGLRQRDRFWQLLSDAFDLAYVHGAADAARHHLLFQLITGLTWGAAGEVMDAISQMERRYRRLFASVNSGWERALMELLQAWRSARAGSDPGLAASGFQRAVDIAKASAADGLSPYVQGIALQELANWHAAQGRTGKAIQLLEEAAGVARRLPSEDLLARVLSELVKLRMKVGSPDQVSKAGAEMDELRGLP